ncbi:MAG: hypothetical protein GY797_09350 [Deltaproteobacteria bacterium]|nr:hypothetical protein [Deltaproteobacteria bacterium]
MSEGNKKCKMFGDCNHYDAEKPEDCTTACEFYNPKNPEEVVEMPDEVVEEERPDVKLEHSGLSKFDKVHEFFVMKKHVFQMQNISPKKIILKYKRRLKETDNLADGCYVFRNQKGELLDPSKTFAKFDREARANAAKAEAEAKAKQGA